MPKRLNWKLALVLLLLAPVPGCIIPIPHTTDRSDDVHGRVLDASTHQPIEGAKLVFVDHPYHATYTDASGYFHRKLIHSFHWAYIFGEDWPMDKDSASELVHPNYLPVWGDWRGGAGDILLQPLPKAGK